MKDIDLKIKKETMSSRQKRNNDFYKKRNNQPQK